MQDTDAAAEADKKLQKRLKRRGYIRKMMRQYREKEKLELAFLQTQKAELEQEMKQLLKSRAAGTPLPVRRAASSGSILSWKEVAIALEDARSLSTKDHANMMLEAEEAEELVRDMTKWVAMHRCIPSMPSPSRTSWRDVSLFTNPRSRALGKDWISQQMYCNATDMFRAHGFPALETHVPFQEAFVTFEDDVATYVRRSQFVTDPRLPIDLLLSMFQNYLCDVMRLGGDGCNTIRERSGMTTLHQMVTHRDEAINLLCGRFSDPSRGMVVVQQIQDDEAWVHDHIQRNRVIWFEINRTTDGRLVSRMLHVISGKAVMWGQEAAEWGMDLSMYATDDMKEAKFRDGRVAHGETVYHESRARLLELTMAAVMKMRAPK
ncbi:Aste57867_8656 [Aphanomyces stellatus]|uniref:Aste57867_8656 protein n=1 Tax=Aphanomyces stellatus TaxID=120398 RepID=A0A485KL78_9STRA|nr:hypothetical protein As57867_008622 [Aphanomyces stellatus]VFT85542.1 Aste57867_8656 [Aphanomyces stellatus]